MKASKLSIVMIVVPEIAVLPGIQEKPIVVLPQGMHGCGSVPHIIRKKLTKKADDTLEVVATIFEKWCFLLDGDKPLV